MTTSNRHYAHYPLIRRGLKESLMSDDPQVYFWSEARAHQARAAWVHRDMEGHMAKLVRTVQQRYWRRRVLACFKKAIEHQRYSAASSRRARKALFTLLGVPEDE